MYNTVEDETLPKDRITEHDGDATEVWNVGELAQYDRNAAHARSSVCLVAKSDDQ